MRLDKRQSRKLRQQTAARAPPLREAAGQRRGGHATGARRPPAKDSYVGTRAARGAFLRERSTKVLRGSQGFQNPPTHKPKRSNYTDHTESDGKA